MDFKASFQLKSISQLFCERHSQKVVSSTQKCREPALRPRDFSLVYEKLFTLLSLTFSHVLCLRIIAATGIGNFFHLIKYFVLVLVPPVPDTIKRLVFGH